MRQHKRFVNADIFDSINQNHCVCVVCVIVVECLVRRQCYRMHSGVKNASINLNSLEKWLAHIYTQYIIHRCCHHPQQWRQDNGIKNKPQRRQTFLFRFFVVALDNAVSSSPLHYVYRVESSWVDSIYFIFPLQFECIRWTHHTNWYEWDTHISFRSWHTY